MADRRVVMQAALDDQAVVLGGELRIVVAGHVSSEEEISPEPRISLLGDPGSSLGEPGLVHARDDAGEGPDPGQVGEAVHVSEAPDDARAKHGANPGCRADDALGVNSGIELGDAGIEAADLDLELSDDPDLLGEVPGQLVEVEAAASPQLDGLVRRIA